MSARAVSSSPTIRATAAYAARLWWLARWIGVRNVAVLDGGMAAWRAAGLPLERAVPDARPRNLSVSLDADAWVSSEAVDDLRRASRKSARRCAQRRTLRRAERNARPIAGHVPGARNRPFPGNLGVRRTIPASGAVAATICDVARLGCHRQHS